MNSELYLQHLLMLILGIVLPSTELELAQNEDRIGDATRSAIRRFLTEQGLTLPGGMEEQSAEWVEWLIQQLEAARQGRCLIFGTIRSQSGEQALPGVKVRAQDRDLPSVERRRSGRQVLGEAVTNQEGSFAIVYTPGQFVDGEVNPPAGNFIMGRHKPGRHPDLSFQIVDEQGQELPIKALAIGDRLPAEIPDTVPEILFNVNEFLQVTIQVEPVTTAELSEYEKFIALLAPIIKDVPLAELTDDDLQFIVHEMGMEPGIAAFGAGGISPMPEWLRRSALLAQQTALPIEAFYGWGRVGVPAPIAELVAGPLEELSAVLDALLAREDVELKRALLEAVERKIIPAGFGERIDNIVRRLKRHNWVQRNVVIQLLDAETAQTLAGYRVATFDVTQASEDLGVDITDRDGKFLVGFSVPSDLPADAPARRFSFQITTPDSAALPEGEPTEINPNQPQSEAVVVRVTVPRVQAPNLETLRQSEQLAIPAELGAYLSEQQIHTFADIRRRGGLHQLADLPAVDLAHIEQLESLADLDRISTDVTINKALLTQYDSVLAVADTPVSEFVDFASNGEVGLPALDATKLHVMARAQTDLLNNMLAGMAANQANGFELREAEGNLPEQLFPQKCGCSDCEAAVSPAAYLAALLDYVLKHVRHNGSKIDLPFLVEMLHQPLRDLPSNCEAVEQQVRQVRLCIEVLRSFLGNRPLSDPQKEKKLDTAEGDYRLATYSMLLNRLGTTYEEIRRSRSETPEKRKALAERLGISLTEPRPADPSGDELDQLLLDPSVESPNPHTLTETTLEKLFGLADTSRDPLSEGAKLGDDQAQVRRWNLNDVQWGEHTDRNGMVYLNLTKDLATNVLRVELFQDHFRHWRVASGQISADAGKVKLVADNDSRLSGEIEVVYSIDRQTIVIAAVPTVLSWRWQHLRAQWAKQDWPDDPYRAGQTQAKLNALPAGLLFPPGIQISYEPPSQMLTFTGVMQTSEKQDLLNLAADDAAYDDYRRAIQKLYRDSQRLPLIDPDVIGPDDFRFPVKKNDGEPDKAFDLWLARRAWVDTTLTSLKDKRERSGLTAILQQALGDPLPDLDALLLTLIQGSAPDAIDAAKKQIADLNLTIERFARLMDIRTKDRLAAEDNRNEKVSEDEWQEVYNILTQAKKVQQFAEWRLAEEKAALLLGMEEFWLSLREPKEGAWPPAPIAGQPLIDPAIHKLTDLPEGKSGEAALDLWRQRTVRLAQIPMELKTEREAHGDPRRGFDAMLRLALGSPNPGDPLQHNMNTLQSDLTSADENIRNNTIKQIETDLHLTVDTFKRLMAIKAKNEPGVVDRPTAAEWAEIYQLLTMAHKVKHEYPFWIQAEQAADLVYWKARKASLPRWRATAEARQLWQQTLHRRSQSPLIDPEVIGREDLRHPASGDPAFDLWEQRRNELANELADLRQTWKDALEAGANPLNALDTILADALGLAASDLLTIEQERQKGQSIEKHLEQLNLTNGAFVYLLRMRGLVEAGQTVTPTEWDTLYATLVQAYKQRKFAAWRHAEQEKSIILTPDSFKIPAALIVPLPALDPAAPLWLSTWQARRDWQDALQSRIDQENSVSEAFYNAISAVEEATLPTLRDALIQASDAAAATVEDPAKWITERLLIDAQSGGCQITTRVAQAIETIQILIFALRTGQFKHLNTIPLTILSDNFDEEWQWMGSYATWRAAMFVFLYPENILQPSLRKFQQTPAFGKMVENIRPLRIDPDRACVEAKSYADYFRDICSLEIEATCQALTNIHSSDSCQPDTTQERHLFYMFGRASSGKAYWSAYDPQNHSGYAQSFWQEVPTFKDVKVLKIVGAMPYYQSGPVRTGSVITRGVGVYEELFKGLVGVRKDPVYEGSSLCLFCIYEGTDGRTSFGLAKLNLESFGFANAWDDKIKELKLDGFGDISSLEIIPVQTGDISRRPKVAFLYFRRVEHNFRQGEVYIRGLDRAASEWEDSQTDWSKFLVNVLDYEIEEVGRGRYRSIRNIPEGVRSLHAVLDIYGVRWFAFTNTKGDLKLFAQKWTPSGPELSNWTWNLRSNLWLGAIPRAEYYGLELYELPVIGESASTLYAFYRSGNTTGYQQFRSQSFESIGPVFDTLSDLERVVPHSGSAPDGQQVFAYQRRKNSNAYYYYRYQESGEQLIGTSTFRAAPRVYAPLDIPERLSAKQLQERRQAIRNAFALNSDATPSVLTYLQEAYYFVPIHLALQLQAAGEYIAALDRFRTVYDYQAKLDERNIYRGLDLDAALSDVEIYQLAGDWLLDPLNSHLIAATRRYAYTRFTIMSLVRCLLDFADAEFTHETGESLARARTLYLTALDLLNLPELQQRLGACEDLIGSLKIEPGAEIPPEALVIVGEIREALTKGKAWSFRWVTATVHKVNDILISDLDWPTRLNTAKAFVQEALANAPSASSTSFSVRKETYRAALTQPSIDVLLQNVGMAAAMAHVSDIAQPAEVRQAVQQDPPVVITPSLQFCIPPNPVLKALRLHVEVNLDKLRSCRNIAGLMRQLDLYAAPTDTTTGLPIIGTGGQLLLPGLMRVQPTLYRYQVLIERAKQMIQLAGQIEAGFLGAEAGLLGAQAGVLNAIAGVLSDAEKREDKRFEKGYSLLKARQELGLAQAGIRLQDLRLIEAKDGVNLAQMQTRRSQIQAQFYQSLINADLNSWEKDVMDAYSEARGIRDTMAVFDAQLTAAQAFLTAGSGGFLGTGLGVGWGAAVANSAIAMQKANEAVRLNSAETRAQTSSMQASFERRRQDWQLQEAVAQQDSIIGLGQISLASDRVAIVGQEKAVAELQATNANDAVEYLAGRITENPDLTNTLNQIVEQFQLTAELYAYIKNVLQGVYRYFLQQATAIAKLAENQLAFERQEVPATYIQSDYWTVATEATAANPNTAGLDRQGLTGSARLLQAIYQLDQYAFNTNKRKLQLSKTVSLALLVPAEFQRFRETGVMVFATPMELFDRAFPGHYLRLIRRVRTSVVALIPPNQGIHATLTTVGISRVVVGPEVFQTVPIRRDPEFVALTSPTNSTGMFELESLQPDFLLPFEGNGVDSSWEFRMPKAANQFDYRTIADVLITIEYTALNSFDYRQQVIQTLNPNLSADRPFSFRNQFADQWYDLHNSDQTAPHIKVKFQTDRADFPPNLETLRIQQVLLYFVRAGQTTFELPITELRFSERGNQGTVGGSATPIDGIISTRRGNAGSWTPMIGKAPVGTWELTLPNTEEVRNHFQNEEIDDILFVITYTGRTPAWPA